MKVLAVYDEKVKAYIEPWYARTTAAAIRSFESAVNDPKTQLSQHPSDFTLFEIGEWDDDKGEIQMYEAKKSLGLAQEFKHQEI